MAKKPKTRILMHFLPTWGIQYHRNPTLNIEGDVMEDPSIILNGILEDCGKLDLREDGASKESLANFKKHILKAVELYEAGDFKALACSMYEFGRQTAYLDYLPYIYEGKVKASKIDANRPVGKRKYNEAVQEVIDGLVNDGDSFADFGKTIKSIIVETEGLADCDEYYYDNETDSLCWTDRNGNQENKIKLASLRRYYKRAIKKF